eukprot:5416570-Prorocentrum_lima.AAC.1
MTSSLVGSEMCIRDSSSSASSSTSMPLGLCSCPCCVAAAGSAKMACLTAACFRARCGLARFLFPASSP